MKKDKSPTKNADIGIYIHTYRQQTHSHLNVRARWIIVAKNGCIRLQRRCSLYASHATNIVYKVHICAPIACNACDTCNVAAVSPPTTLFFSLCIPAPCTKLYAAMERRGCTHEFHEDRERDCISSRGNREFFDQNWQKTTVYMCIKVYMRVTISRKLPRCSTCCILLECWALNWNFFAL